MEPAIHVAAVHTADFLVPGEVRKLLAIPNFNILTTLHLPYSEDRERDLVVNL